MDGFWKALANKQTTIVGAIVILGSFVKLFFVGQEPVIDQLTGSVSGFITNLIQIGVGVGLLLAKDGATGSNPGV
jgi:hypothetical protein